MGTEATGQPAEHEIKDSPAEECKCYCFVKWGAAIAAPFVPRLPTTISTWFFIYEVETEDGEEFWTADVNEKTYVCNTQQVLGVTPLVLNLVHNDYQTSRSRWVWNPWPAAWGPKVKSAVYGNAKALGTSSPPALPECTAVGIACP
jgi:hypothetical protein